MIQQRLFSFLIDILCSDFLFVFLVGAHPVMVRDYFSGTDPSGAWLTIWDTKNRTQVKCVPDKRPTFYTRPLATVAWFS